MKLSLKVALASVMLMGAALVLTLGDSAEAGGKAQKHLDVALRKLKEAERALFDAGAKETKQKTLEPGVLGQLTMALRSVQNAYLHTLQAKNLDNPNLKK